MNKAISRKKKQGKVLLDLLRKSGCADNVALGKCCNCEVNKTCSYYLATKQGK